MSFKTEDKDMGRHRCIIQTSKNKSFNDKNADYFKPMRQNAPMMVDDVSTP